MLTFGTETACFIDLGDLKLTKASSLIHCIVQLIEDLGCCLGTPSNVKGLNGSLKVILLKEIPLIRTSSVLLAVLSIRLEIVVDCLTLDIGTLQKVFVVLLLYFRLELHSIIILDSP